MKEAAPTDAQEEGRFRHALVAFERPELARRTAESIFTDLIRPQDRGHMFVPMLQRRQTRLIAWDVLRARWDEHVAKMSEPLMRQAYFVGVSQLAQPDLVDEAIRFLEQKRTADISEIVAQGIERLRVNTAAAQRLGDELEEALKVATPA
jgi:aminopeptidase N